MSGPNKGRNHLPQELSTPPVVSGRRLPLEDLLGATQEPSGTVAWWLDRDGRNVVRTYEPHLNHAAWSFSVAEQVECARRGIRPTGVPERILILALGRLLERS